MEVRLIHSGHIDAVKSLADANRDSLGFMTHKKLEEIVEQKRGIVALQDDTVIGFVFFRHRKIDMQTTLSEICVQTDCRGQHVGTQLICGLIRDCEQRCREFIQLKCPVDLPSNEFYRKMGFRLHMIEDGRRRQLKVWRLSIPTRQIEEP